MIHDDCFLGEPRETTAKEMVAAISKAGRYEDCKPKLVSCGMKLSWRDQIYVAFRAKHLLRIAVQNGSVRLSRIPYIDWLDSAWNGGKENWIAVAQE